MVHYSTYYPPPRKKYPHGDFKKLKVFLANGKHAGTLVVLVLQFFEAAVVKCAVESVCFFALLIMIPKSCQSCLALFFWDRRRRDARQWVRPIGLLGLSC